MSDRELKGKSLIDFPDCFTIIDIETTGLDPEYDSIIELAAVRIREGELVGTFSSLVRPDTYYILSDDDANENYVIVDGEKIQYVDAFIEELTGITNKMLLDAPALISILPSFIDFIGDDVLVGHNVHFDINFIYDSAMEVLQKAVGNNFIDTMRLSRRLLKDLPHHRLRDISIYYKIDGNGTHRALGDCTITLDCFFNLKNTALNQYESIEEFKDYIKKNCNFNLKVSDIKAIVDIFDKTHPLYNKVCVFTGTLEKMVRRDAMQIIANLGGVNGDGVTAKTNYLVLGNNDYCPSIKDGKSIKQKKAEQLILKGQDLQILSENVFYELVKQD